MLRKRSGISQALLAAVAVMMGPLRTMGVLANSIWVMQASKEVKEKAATSLESVAQGRVDGSGGWGAGAA